MLRLFKQYYPIRNIIFFMSEGAFIFVSVLLAAFLLVSPDSIFLDLMLVFKIALITFVCQVSLYYNDLYDFQIATTLIETGIRLLQALGITAIVLAGIYFWFPIVVIDQSIFCLSVLFLLLIIIGWRFVYISILTRGYFNENIIILGSNHFAQDIFNTINDKIDCGYSVSAIVPDMDSELPVDPAITAKAVVLKPGVNLCETALEIGVKKVVVALTERRGSFPAEDLIRCRVQGIDVLEGNTFYEMLTGKLLVKKINPAWLIFSDGFRKSTLRTVIKRLEDIVMSFSVLVLLSPAFAMVAIAIKLDSKGPIVFSQDRVGQRKKEFMVHKFRSMVDNAEKLSGPVWAQNNDARITRLGAIIRKYRIDEFPQFWDVLIGKMSIVGPRPERKHFTDELEEQIPYYSQRFVVKPGITGWAQVSYDYGASVEDAIEKLNYDLFYVKNMSTMFDIVIILRTIKTVLFGKGAR